MYPFIKRNSSLLGGLIPLAIAMPWYLAVRHRAGEAFFREVLWGQNSRFVDTVSHRRPFFYYVLPMLYDLFPWCLPALAALPAAWKLRRESPAAALALSWLSGMLLLLSAATVKQEKYLLPLLPSAALLAAWMLGRSPGLLPWTARLVAWVLIPSAAALGISAWASPLFAGPCIGLGISALICSFCCLRYRAVAACLAAFFLAAASVALPALNAFKSVKPFSEAAARLAGSRPLAFYGEDLQAAYPFHAGRRVDYIQADGSGGERLAAYLRMKPDAILLLRRRDLNRLPPEMSSRLREALPGCTTGKEVLAVHLAVGAP